MVDRSTDRVCVFVLLLLRQLFAKGSRIGDEPRRAVLLAWLIAQAFGFIGSLNDVAPLLTDFFLTAYGLVCPFVPPFHLLHTQTHTHTHTHTHTLSLSLSLLDQCTSFRIHAFHTL